MFCLCAYKFVFIQHFFNRFFTFDCRLSSSSNLKIIWCTFIKIMSLSLSIYIYIIIFLIEMNCYTARIFGIKTNFDKWIIINFYNFSIWVKRLISVTVLLSLIHKIGKALFLAQIFEVEILMDWYVLRFHESENHIFSAWSVCMCVCVCLCVSMSVS